MHFVEENRPLSFFIPTKLHFKLVCMKRWVCRDKASSSLTKFRQGKFVFKLETFFESSFGLLKSLAGDFGCPSIDLQQYLFLFHNRRISLCVENKMVLSHRCLVFCRSSWFLSKLKAGCLARQESQMAKSVPISSTLTKGSKVFENIQAVVIQKCSNQNCLT